MHPDCVCQSLFIASLHFYDAGMQSLQSLYSIIEYQSLVVSVSDIVLYRINISMYNLYIF